MNKTDYKLCVGKKSGYDVYRAVVTDGNRFFVKYNGELLDVTEDKDYFTYK